jgi:hypothetical protein
MFLFMAAAESLEHCERKAMHINISGNTAHNKGEATLVVINFFMLAF